MLDGLGRSLRWAPVAFAVILGAYVTARVAALPAGDLVTYVSDDTFYYLVLARNLASTGHLTFDGVNSASGVHPAWLTLTALMSAMGVSGLALVRAAIALAFAFHLLGGYFIVRIFERAGAARVAPWAAALWLANPVALGLVVEAMEAPMFVAVLTGACLAVQRLIAGGPAASGAWWRASAVLGLLCLVRTDGLVVTAIAALMIALVLWRRGDPVVSIFKAVAVIGAGSALAVAAFALWLRLETGYFTQASGELKMFWGSIAGTQAKLAFLYHSLVRLTFGAFGHEMLGLPTKVSAIAGGGALALAAAGLAARFRRQDFVGSAIALWVLAAASVATAIYALVLFEYKPWYLGLPAFAFVLTIAVEAGARFRARTFAAGSMLALAAMTVADFRLASARNGTYPYARAIYESVAVFDQLVPEGEPIASFDAGVRGYFATHRIINLDGLVNDATRPYWKAGRLDLYLDRERVEYLADEEGNFPIARQFTAFPAVDPIACVPVRGTVFRDRCLWRVRR